MDKLELKGGAKSRLLARFPWRILFDRSIHLTPSSESSFAVSGDAGRRQPTNQLATKPEIPGPSSPVTPELYEFIFFHVKKKRTPTTSSSSPYI
jgi:hypothetical protein